MDTVVYALLMKEITRVKQMVIKTGGVLDVRVNNKSVVDSNGNAKITLPAFPDRIASKDDIDNLEEEIAKLSTLSFEIVDSLPTTGKTGTIYLVKTTIRRGLFSKKNEYIEYIWLDAKKDFEELGSLSIGDLDNYVTKAYLESYHDSAKQNTISDLTDIREGAALGKTALQSVPEEYAKKTDLPTVPTKISAFENDEGYLKSFTEEDPTVPTHVKAITEADITSWNNKSDFSGSYDDLTNKPTIPSIEGLATESYVNEHHDTTKQDTINDLDTIRSGAELGATALQSFTEEDPTVPNHVKSITEENITSWSNKSDFSGSYNDLTDKPTIPDSSKFVTLDTAQTISGTKKFAGPSPSITITDATGSTANKAYSTVGFDGFTTRNGSNFFKTEYNTTNYTNKFGYKINTGTGTTKYISIPDQTGTLAMLEDIPVAKKIFDCADSDNQGKLESYTDGKLIINSLASNYDILEIYYSQKDTNGIQYYKIHTGLLTSSSKGLFYAISPVADSIKLETIEVTYVLPTEAATVKQIIIESSAGTNSEIKIERVYGTKIGDQLWSQQQRMINVTNSED